MEIDIEYNLTTLREAVDHIIDNIPDHRKAGFGAINWGDLRCVEARFYIDDRGDQGYSILIEEAAPANYDFQRYVLRELEAIEYYNVEVNTEW